VTDTRGGEEERGEEGEREGMKAEAACGFCSAAKLGAGCVEEIPITSSSRLRSICNREDAD